MSKIRKLTPNLHLCKTQIVVYQLDSHLPPIHSLLSLRQIYFDRVRRFGWFSDICSNLECLSDNYLRYIVNLVK